MSEEKIRQEIEELRQELESASDISLASKDKLLVLVGDIEAQLQSKEQHSLADQADEMIADFEVSHPTLAAVIKRTMETLANIGI
ncbi:MAG: transcriptional antiterminator [Chitinophagales bacterium]|jgi:transcriptional antiterminator